jgi:hypothetical protein
MKSRAFGEALERALRDTNTTRVDFCQDVGLTPSYLSRLINAKLPVPSEETIRDWGKKRKWKPTQVARLLELARTPEVEESEAFRLFRSLALAMAQARPHDPLIRDLQPGGIVFRLIKELAISSKISAEFLRDAIAMMCAAHERLRISERELELALQQRLL